MYIFMYNICLFEGVRETQVIQTPGAWREGAQAAVHATTLAASAPSAASVASVAEFKTAHFRLKTYEFCNMWTPIFKSKFNDFSPLSSIIIGFVVKLQPLSSIIVSFGMNFNQAPCAPGQPKRPHRMAKESPGAFQREPKEPQECMDIDRSTPDLS